MGVRIRRACAVAALLGIVGAVVVTDGPAGAAPVPGAPSSGPTPLLSLRRTPGLVAETVAGTRLAVGVLDVLGRSVPDSCLVVTGRQGTIVSHKGGAPLVPASTMKLLTASVALDVFGEDASWTTTAASDRPVADGTVGSIFLVGGGDPVLGTAGYAGSLRSSDTRAVTSLDSLADQVVAAGVRRVTDGVVGDGGRHESAWVVPGWSGSYLEDDTVGGVGALRVNGGTTGWRDDPSLPGRRGAATEPAAEAAAIFATLLRQRGVEVGPAAAPGVTPPTAVSLGSISSPRLPDVINEVLSWSNNGAAEMLLREIGLRSLGEGSTAAGARAVAAALETQGLPTTGLAQVDGSGLHTENRVTCDLLVGLMDRVVTTPALLDGLAVAGVDGTLSGRLGEEGVAGLVRAKTGTLWGVLGLAGAVLAADGEVIRFAYLSNGQRGDLRLLPDRPDDLVRVLRRYPDEPTLDALGPRAVDDTNVD